MQDIETRIANCKLLSMAAAWAIVFACLYKITCMDSGLQMMLVLLTVAMGVALYMLFFNLLLHFFKEKGAILGVGFSNRVNHVVAFLVVAGGGFLWANRFETETQTMNTHYGRTDFLWEVIPWEMVLVVSVAATVFVVAALHTEKSKNIQGNRFNAISTLFCYLLALVAYGYCLYAPNILTNDMHHMTAALQTVYNVAFDVPFNIYTTGIYGHSAIFLWPFLKLFGHQASTVALLMSGIGIVCEAFLLYAIHNSIKSDVVRRVTALASVMPIVAMYPTAYLQLHPLRMFPPMVLLAYVVWVRKHMERFLRTKLILGYALCAGSITWSTDAGLIATIAYSAWIVCYFWQQEKIFSKRMIKIYAGVLAGVVASVVGMVLLVNLYNVLICHSEFIFRACFFPFIGGGGFVTELKLPLQWKNYSWIYVLFLFYIGIAKGVSGIRLLHGKHNELSDILFFCAVMGLGQSGYYFNRAAYFNLSVIIPEATFCMGIIVYQTLVQNETMTGQSLAKPVQKGISVIMLAQLSVLAAATIFVAGDSIRYHTDQGHYDMTSLQEAANQVAEKIPKDTYAVGGGTQEIYAELGWNPGYFWRDVSDFWGNGIEKVQEDINSQPALLVTEGYESVVLSNQADWELVDSVTTDRIQLNYYVRKADQ